MNAKKSLVAAAVVAVVGAGSVAVPGLVSAETSAVSGNSSLVDKLAQKFSLNKEEVRTVFDEDMSARKTEMQAQRSERLQKAVDEGKLTTEQKALIENKLKELQAKHKADRDALKKWAADNSIDEQYLMPGTGHGQKMMTKHF